MDEARDSGDVTGDDLGDRGISRRQLIKRGAVVGGAMVWTVPTVQTLNMSVARAQVSPAPVTEATFLVLDSETIDNGTPPNFFVGTEINDDIKSTSQRSFLRFFNDPANIGNEIDLYSGQVGDEGWFALKTIPATWNGAGPTADGLQNYIQAGPGLGDGEDLLDNVPDVTPLRAEGLSALVGQTVAAIVHDGDVGINYGPLTGSLKGAYLGLVAFEVLSVTTHPDGGSVLPVVHIKIVDPAPVFAGTLVLFTSAPAPTSSSDPMDVKPGEPG